MKRDEKLMTVDIKTFSREELEMAYEKLRKVSAMKTDLIKKMEFKKQAKDGMDD